MTKNVIAAVVGSVCAMFLWEADSLAQGAVSGTSLSISGPASISGSTSLDSLTVSGTADFLSNTLFFGTSGSNSALSLSYDDGGNSSITLQSTRPSSVWNWQRLTASGTSSKNVMQLDASNRLILTGTADTNPPQLVLDPNGAISLGGSNLLTQAAANSLYLSATSGLTATNGRVGVGISNPTSKLDVRQSSGGLAPGSLASFYANGGSNDLASKVTIQSNSSSYGQVQIGGSGKEVSLAYISEVSAFGAAPISNLGNAGVVNQGLGLYSDTGDVYSVASDAAGGPIFRIKSSGYGSIGGAVDTNYKWSVYGSEHISGTAIIDGNVGIGMLNPVYKLDISSASEDVVRIRSTTSHPAIVLDRGLGNSFSSIKFRTNGATEYRIGQQGGSTLDFGNNNYKFLSITASGNIGIGTTTPQAKLDVNGSANVSGTLAISGSGALKLPDGTVLSGSNTLGSVLTNGTISNLTLSGTTKILGGLDVGSASVNGSSLITQTDADTRYFSATAGLSAANGNIGIGTDSPQSMLDVVGSASFANGATTIDASGNGYFAGRVGIGTTNPSAQLEVYSSTSSAYASFNFAGDAPGDLGSNAMGLSFTNDWYTEGALSVLAGTYPGAGLLQGDQIALWSLGQNGLLFMTRSPLEMGTPLRDNGDQAGPIVFATGGCVSECERMRITPGGNIGIGTSTPQAKLDVVGDAKISGNLALTGTTTVTGGLVISGTAVPSGTATKIVASGSNQLVLIPEQGDLSMGDFTHGSQPPQQ